MRASTFWATMKEWKPFHHDNPLVPASKQLIQERLRRYLLGGENPRLTIQASNSNSAIRLKYQISAKSHKTPFFLLQCELLSSTTSTLALPIPMIPTGFLSSFRCRSVKGQILAQ
ncbi:unnamed protein product [Polarella glacialis]|uniref:Uncharacterized protein n=1 Tax=Polarella glacialis TaxID=89957 RepID=A0A813HBS1_POLGL|nr:unnamed protein product [Polarella glacialis]